jgi:hypothetical protein
MSKLNAGIGRLIRHAYGKNVASLPWHLAARLQELDLLAIDPDTQKPLFSPEEFADACSQIRDGVKPVLFATPRLSRNVFRTTDVLGSTNSVEASSLGGPLTHLIEKTSKSPETKELAHAYLRSIDGGSIPRMVAAAARLYEALEFDVDWQVLVLQNSASLQAADILNEQLSKLLGLDFAEPKTLVSLQSQFDTVLQDISEPLSISDLVNDPQRYAEAFAHLPLATSASLHQLVDSLTDKKDIKAFWSVAEKWLNLQMPGLWFNIWLAAMRHPTSAPKVVRTQSWRNVETILSAHESERDNFANRYAQLTRYFYTRIELTLPNVRADFALWCASTLARSVAHALIFVKDATDDGFMTEPMKNVQWLWKLSGPYSPYTSLRAAMLGADCIWSAAIQASVNEWDKSQAEKLPKSIRPLLIKAVRDAALLVYEHSIPDIGIISPHVLSHISTLRSEWSTILKDEISQQWINGYKEYSEKYAEPESVVQRLKKPFGLPDDGDAAVAVRVWAAMVSRGQISIDSAIDMIFSKEWTENIEPTLSIAELEIVLTGLHVSNWASGRASIRAELPHWAARRCIFHSKDIDRRQLYLPYTAILCIRSGATSAMLRLKKEEGSSALTEELAGLRNFLLASMAATPPWLQGRIRALLCAIH